MGFSKNFSWETWDAMRFFSDFLSTLAINLRSVTDNLLGVPQRFSVWAAYTQTASVYSYEIP